MSKVDKSMWIKIASVVVVVLIIGFWYLNKKYEQGYKKAVADIKAQQVDTNKKVTQEAVDQANPFKVANPLKGVDANPFEKAKKALNPFN